MGTTADKLNKVLETKEAIRTAINNKGGTLTETDTFASYATAIENIQSGSANEPITITENGTYTAPEGVGYSPVNVNVPSKEEETKSITIIENGTTTILPTSGKVLSKVDITTNVPQSGGSLKTLLDATKSAMYLFSNYRGTSVDDLISYNDTSNVADMSQMFNHCSYLTTIPQLDTSSCINISKMFYQCYNLKSIPQLNTSNVIDMSYMFYDCNALTSNPQLDTSNVSNMSYMFYDCQKLTTIPQLNTSNVSNMSYMFKNCQSLKTIDLTYMNITSTNSSYFAYNCYSLTKLIIRNMGNIPVLNSNTFQNCFHFYGTTDPTYNPEGLKDGRIYVPNDKVEALKTATNWSVFADIITAIDFIDGGHISKIYINNNQLKLNTPRKAEIYLNEFTNIPTVDITISNESIAQINNITTTTEKITFEVIALGEVGNATITVNVSGDYSKTLTIEVKYIPPIEYRVEEISEATYGFTLNSNKYYESTNKKVSSSYSLCKLVFNATEISNTLKLECINSGEGNFDFGILSNIDTTLSLSANEDTTNVYKSFKGQSSTAPVVITYPEATVGEHFIYIKYRKDGGGDKGNDSLQFKVIS